MSTLSQTPTPTTTLSTPKTCLQCDAPIVTGRFDKIFCSVLCKNSYHIHLRRTTGSNESVIRIDRILHRNHGILLELMGEGKVKLKFPRIELDKKKFNYS